MWFKRVGGSSGAIGRSIGDGSALSEKKIVMCKKTKDLGDVLYDVEIALAKDKMILSAHSAEYNETIIVDIPSDKSTENNVITGSKTDFEGFRRGLRTAHR